MNRRGHRGRTDANHTEVVQALRKMAWGVWSTAQIGDGFPDLLAVKHGRVVLIEVKDGSLSPSRRRLTLDERMCHNWFKCYGVEVVTVTKVSDLQQLDRDARMVHEPYPSREFYP